MKILKDIFLFIIYEMNCTKEDFIRAANQESKSESYFTLMHMICKIISTFIAIVGLLLLFICVLMIVLATVIHYPIILLPIFIIICLPYVILKLCNKKEKGNKNENKN